MAHRMTNINLRALAASPGYTLVEMLVALTLLGFVMVLIGGTFQVGLRTWEGSAQAFDRQARIDAVQSLLRRELSQARQLYFDSAAVERRPVFVGGSDHLRFSAPLSIHHASGGIAVFNLQLDRDGTDGDLVLQWQVFRPDAPDGQAAERAILLSDVEALEIAYFGQASDRDAAVWQAEWKDMPTLPDLVRIELGFPDSDPRVWPSFIVAIRTGGYVQR